MEEAVYDLHCGQPLGAIKMFWLHFWGAAISFIFSSSHLLTGQLSTCCQTCTNVEIVFFPTGLTLQPDDVSGRMSEIFHTESERKIRWRQEERPDHERPERREAGRAEEESHREMTTHPLVSTVITSGEESKRFQTLLSACNDVIVAGLRRTTTITSISNLYLFNDRLLRSK